MRLSRVFAASFSLLCFSSFSTFAQGQSSARIVEDGIPILFEPAPSQLSGPVAMTGRLPGATVVCEPGKVQVQLLGSPTGQFEIGFVGASKTSPYGNLRAASQTNYLLGKDPTRWRTHVPNYQQVVYSELYPGIKAVFYGNRQRLEHDFVVSPGADYHQIRLHLSPDAHATVDSRGDLNIALRAGKLQMHKPVIYQDLPGGRQLRSGGFRLLPDGDITFTVGSYDSHRTLVIDPVLSVSTYLSDKGNGGAYLAIDSSGNNYLTGIASLGFPQTAGALQGCGTCTTNEIISYVSKLSPDGKSLIYSTLIGGNGYTQSFAIAADAGGNAFVTGRTQATDFPVKNGQTAGPSSGAFYYGFLLSLSADGSSLNYGTLLGGSPNGEGWDTEVTAVVADAAGNAYIGGSTNSTLYPYTTGALNNGSPSNSDTQVFATETTQSSVVPALGMALGGFLLLLPLRKCPRSIAFCVAMGLVLMTGGLSGCGGGGSATPTQPSSPAMTTVAPGTYTIQVVASDGATTQKTAVTLVVGG